MVTPRIIKIIARAYTICSILLFAINVFSIVSIPLIIEILYPFLGIVVIALSKGSITLSNPKGNNASSLSVGIGFSTATLLFNYCANYFIAEYDHLFLLIFIVSIIFGLLLNYTDSARLPNIIRRIILIAISLVYGFSSVCQINCAYDKSAYKSIPAAVVSHRISKGKMNNYYISVNPWGPLTDTPEYEVSETIYNHQSIGSKVIFHLKPGLLHAPWYVLPY